MLNIFFAALRAALHTHGVTTHDDGGGLPGAGHIFLLDATDEATYDLVRDTVADLGLGLVRMEQRRHHIAEVFRSQDEPQPEQVSERAAAWAATTAAAEQTGGGKR